MKNVKFVGFSKDIEEAKQVEADKYCQEAIDLPVEENITKTIEDTKLEQSTNLSEYVGMKCIPKKWAAQKDGLITTGLEFQFRLQLPLIIKKSWRKNIGKGCENTVFFQFEGQTDNSHFIGLHFKPVKDE